MPNSEQIFRQAALDRLASPEQLDELMQVTTPRSVWALGACCTLIGLAIVWSIFGVIPSKVSGSGILIKQGGVFVTTARTEGSVMDIHVQLGQAVTNRQLLVQLQLPELELKIKHAHSAQVKLRQELERLDKFHVEEAESERVAHAQQLRTYEEMIRDFKQLIASQQERVTNMQQLLGGESGAVAKVQLLALQHSVFEAQHELARAQIQVKEIHLNSLQAKERRRQQQSEKQAQLLQGEQNIEWLTEMHQLSSVILSPFDGTVLDIMVKPGQLINPNSPIVSLQNTKETLEARLFLPSAEGKRVERNMPVHLSPVSVKKELFGVMEGRVKEVSLFPVRNESMLRILENPTLVNEFSQRGAPIEVVVELQPDPKTWSGYAWTSGKGPAVSISSGTLCEGSITVTNHRPINLVLPIFQNNVRW